MSSKETATKMADEIKRHYYLTPTNYLDSMHLFAKMLTHQQQKITRNKYVTVMSSGFILIKKFTLQSEGICYVCYWYLFCYLIFYLILIITSEKD